MNYLIIASLIQISDEVSDILYIVNDDFSSQSLKISFIFFTAFQFGICLVMTTFRYINGDETCLNNFDTVLKFIEKSKIAAIILFPFYIIVFLFCLLLLTFQIFWRTLIAWFKLDVLFFKCEYTKKFISKYIFILEDDKESELIALHNQIQSIEIIFEGIPHLIIQIVNATQKEEWTLLDIIFTVITGIDISFYTCKIIFFLKGEIQEKYVDGMVKSSKLISKVLIYIAQIFGSPFYLIYFFICKVHSKSKYNSYCYFIRIQLIILTIYSFGISIVDNMQYLDLLETDYRIVLLDEIYQQSVIVEYQKMKICKGSPYKSEFEEQIQCEWFGTLPSQSSNQFISHYSLDNTKGFIDLYLYDKEDDNKAIRDCKRDNSNRMKECLDNYFKDFFFPTTENPQIFIFIMWSQKIEQMGYYVKSICRNYDQSLLVEDALERILKRIRYPNIRDQIQYYQNVILAQSTITYVLLFFKICFVLLCIENEDLLPLIRCLGFFLDQIIFIICEIIGYINYKNLIPELDSYGQQRYHIISECYFALFTYFIINVIIGVSKYGE